MFSEEDIIYKYTVEDGLEDGAFIDITNRVKGILKWQTILSNSLFSKVKELNTTEEDIDIIIKDIATMFSLNAIHKNINDDLMQFRCILKADLDYKDSIIYAAINYSKSNKPVMTFLLKEDL